MVSNPRDLVNKVTDGFQSIVFILFSDESLPRLLITLRRPRRSPRILVLPWCRIKCVAGHAKLKFHLICQLESRKIPVKSTRPDEFWRYVPPNLNILTNKTDN